MIKTKLLKQLSVEFQKVKPKKNEETTQKKKTIEVSFIQNMNFQKEAFYKPISKIVYFE